MQMCCVGRKIYSFHEDKIVNAKSFYCFPQMFQKLYKTGRISRYRDYLNQTAQLTLIFNPLIQIEATLLTLRCE